MGRLHVVAGLNFLETLKPLWLIAFEHTDLDFLHGFTTLLDVSEGDYGVPSRIEDDELLDLVMPQPETFEYAEERRLFYVALTRASRGVFQLTNGREPSRYIRELSEIAGENLRFETIDGDPLHQCPA